MSVSGLVVGLLVVGGGVLAGGLVLRGRVRRIRAWPTVEARVVERAVGLATQPTGGARRGRFVPKVRYVFEAAGRSYEGHALSPVQQTMTAERAQEVADAIPASVEIHYDPTDPTRSYIHPGSLTLAVTLTIVGSSLLLLALGALLGP